MREEQRRSKRVGSFRAEGVAEARRAKRACSGDWFVAGWSRGGGRGGGEQSRETDGVHPGVARSLGRLVAFSEGRTPSHPDAAEVRPCHPDQATTTALNERRSCGQERCLKLLAVNHEVVRRLELLRRRWR